MTEPLEKDVTQRLRDIREVLDGAIVANEDDPGILENIHVAYQQLDHLDSLPTADVPNQTLSALEESIRHWVSIRDDVISEASGLQEQGLALFERFQLGGSLDDLEQAITSWQRLVDLIPPRDPRLPATIGILGMTFAARFEQHGSLTDLENAILSLRQAVSLTPDKHPNKPIFVNSLGLVLQKRFERHESLIDLEDAISSQRQAVSLAPDGDQNKPMYLSNLVLALQTRFERHGSLTDLEDAISTLRQAVSLTPDDHPDKSEYLSNLGIALQKRFKRRASLTDLEDAISSHQQAVSLTPDGHPDKPIHLNNLGGAIHTRFSQQGLLTDLEDAISSQRQAVSLTPDGHPDKPRRLSNIGIALQTRFERQGSLTDLEDAISSQQQAVSLTPDGHPDKQVHLSHLGNALHKRFERHGSLKDLEDAISSQRQAVSLIPEGHPDKPMFFTNLGITLRTRFERHGLHTDLEDAISSQQQAVSLTPDGHPDKPMYLSNLGITLQTRFEGDGSLIDLEDAISSQWQAVSLTPDGHPDKPMYLSNLGITLQKRFKRHGSLADLKNAILSHRQAVSLTPDSHLNKAMYLFSLGVVLWIRFQNPSLLARFGRAFRRLFGLPENQKHLRLAISALQGSVHSVAGSSKSKLNAALFWADCCALGSISPLLAFQNAIDHLPRIAWLGLAVDDQYALLSESGKTTRSAVAAAVAEGEYSKAVEWSEQGRSIVWQKFLSLRTPLDELASQHMELAERLQEVSLQLERPAETLDSPDGPPSTGNVMGLAIERDHLIEQIRSKSGFEHFMQPRSLDELTLAVRDGPVVFLNLAEARCDAVIFLKDDCGDSPVVVVPLERVTLRATERLLQEFLWLLRSVGVAARSLRKVQIEGDVDDKQEVFKKILQTLWIDYVQPVVNRLGYPVNIETPPRLWWCATGPLAFLPLHAAGMYDMEEAGHKLSDYVISSYTPTLEALLDQSPPSLDEELKILAVSVSNAPNAPPLPCTEEEAEKLQRLAANLPFVSLKNEEATKERVLDELERGNWIHLACHGAQVGGKPMESGLLLHDGMLDLSRIVKMRLPNADFAFLSACQTAVGDQGVPEESAHLAAGMLFAGCSGVLSVPGYRRGPRTGQSAVLDSNRNLNLYCSEIIYILSKYIASSRIKRICQETLPQYHDHSYD